MIPFLIPKEEPSVIPPGDVFFQFPFFLRYRFLFMTKLPETSRHVGNRFKILVDEEREFSPFLSTTSPLPIPVPNCTAMVLL